MRPTLEESEILEEGMKIDIQSITRNAKTSYPTTKKSWLLSD